MKKISTLFKKDINDLSKVINEINPENDWVLQGLGIATRKFDGTATAIINGELYKRYDAKLKPLNGFIVGDTVTKKSGKPFKNGELVDKVISFGINDNTPNKEMGAWLENSDTIVSLSVLQVVGKFSTEYKNQPPIDAIPCQEPDLMSGHHPHWIKCDRNKPEDKYFFIGYDSLENKKDGTYELIGEKIQGNPEKIEGFKLVKHGSEIVNLGMIYDFEYIKSFLNKEDIEGIVFHHVSDGRMCKIRKVDFGIKR